MTDLPILFSAPMVRALLDGRKTQTRRIIKPQPGPCDHKPWPGVYEPRWKIDGTEMYCATCGNGVALTRDGKGTRAIPLRFAKGDRLWVRETVACGSCAPGKPSHWAPSFWRREQGTPKNPNGLWYASDDLAPERPITQRGRWVPGIHMPRWASRLTLTVTDVRVQRLRECSGEDAIAEGITGNAETGWLCRGVDVKGDVITSSPQDAYRLLWEAINGAGSWDANPWIVAVTFTVERRNIDAKETSK